MLKFKSYIFYTIIVLVILILSITVKNVKKNIDNKSDQISFLKKNLKNKKNQLRNIHTKLLDKNINIENIIFEEGISFKNNKKQTFKLDNIDYNKLTDVKSVVDDAKDDLTSIKDELKEEIEKFDTWADEESKKEPMIITGFMSQGQ